MKLISGIAHIIIFFVFNTYCVLAQNLDAVCVGSTESYAVSGLPESVFIWEVDDPKAEIENRGDSATIHWGSPGVHKITVKEVSKHGCEGSPVYAFVTVEFANVNFEDEIHLCEGDEQVLDAGEFDYYSWNNGSTSRIITIDNGGKYWVNVSTESGCYGSDTTMIHVHKNPELDLGNDTVLCGNETLTLDGGFFDSYQWSTGDNSRFIDVFAMRQMIHLEVTDEFGCTSQDSILIAECDAASMFKDIPNAITPNNDGVHDVWEIPNIELYPDAKVEIFDRWGRLVFKKDGDYHNDWDGNDMNGNKLPMDSYYYVIDLKKSGSSKVVGNVTIIR